MAKRPKKYTADEKARIALEALKGDLTLSQITAKYGIHTTQINRWKKILRQGVVDIFRTKNIPVIIENACNVKKLGSYFLCGCIYFNSYREARIRIAS